MTVESMLGSMTHQEFVEWQAFASIEPLNGRRLDVLAAQIAYAVFATAPRKKGARIPAFEKFVPQWWEQRREASPDAMLGFAAAMTRRMGGTVGPRAEEALAGGERRDANGDAEPRPLEVQ